MGNDERREWIEALNARPKAAWDGPSIAPSAFVHETAVLDYPGETFEKRNDGTLLVAEPHGGVRIGDHAVVGPYAVIRRATMPAAETTIGAWCRISAMVNVGHNSVLGRRVFVGPHATLCGSVTVGDDAWIGPQAVVHQHVHVGKGAVVGIGSVVTRNVPDGMTVAGSPARPVPFLDNSVDPSFAYGERLQIGRHNEIHENVRVGDDVTIKSHVELRPGTTVGDRTYIDSYVRSSGDNRIGNDVTLRFGATIARAVVIDDGAFVSPNVMTIYSTHEGKKRGGTLVGRDAFIGTNAVLGPGVKIGAKVVIAALAYVTKDCLEPGVYGGVPAKRIR